jgi:ArsR family transcriptional regulator, arsenate/arsenite/antimonite-responsive transcriptional repressor
LSSDDFDGAALERVLKALADRRRLQIALLLAERGELPCKEIVARFALTQATISHHLKVLTDAGVLACRREGQFAYFSLDERTMEAFRLDLGRLFSEGRASRGAAPESESGSTGARRSGASRTGPR